MQLGIHTRIIEVVTDIDMEHKQDRNHTGVRMENYYTKRFYQSLGIDLGSTFTNMSRWVCITAQVLWFDESSGRGILLHTRGLRSSSREANYFTITC